MIHGKDDLFEETETDQGRRKFLGWMGATTLLSLTPGVMVWKEIPPRRGKTLNLRLAVASGCAHYGDRELHESIADFASRARGRSGGWIGFPGGSSIRVLPGQQLAESLVRGEADAVFCSSARYFPGHIFFGAMPNGLDPARKARWLVSEPAFRLWNAAYETQGLHSLFFSVGAPSYGQVADPKEASHDSRGALTIACHDQCGHWFREAGLTGLRVRTLEEMRIGLRDGWLGVSEPLSHSYCYSAGLHRLGKPYFVNSWMRTSHVFQLVMLKKTWDSIPRDLQLVLRQSAREAGLGFQGKITRREELSLGRIAGESSFEVQEFPEDLRPVFADKAEAFKRRVSREDRVSGEIYAAYQGFLKAVC